MKVCFWHKADIRPCIKIGASDCLDAGTFVQSGAVFRWGRNLGHEDRFYQKPLSRDRPELET